jgi:putative cell wall-binding protein
VSSIDFYIRRVVAHFNCIRHSCRYFKYQMANVLIIVLTGSIFQSLQGILTNPTSIVIILGKSLPQVSVFFMNYVITQLFSGVPAMLFK